MKKKLFLLVLGLTAISLYGKEYRIPVQNKLSYTMTLNSFKNNWEEYYGLEVNFPLTIKPGETKKLVVNVPSEYAKFYGTELPVYMVEPDVVSSRATIDYQNTRKVVITESGENVVIRAFSR